MFVYLDGRGAHLNTAARLRRVIAALAVVTSGLLGWAGAVPAASATVVPVTDGPYGPAPATPGGTVRVITAGGMPAGRSPSSRPPPPWSRPPPRCSWTARGPAGPLRPPDDTQSPGPDTGRECQAGVRQPHPHAGPAPEHPYLRPPGDKRQRAISRADRRECAPSLGAKADYTAWRSVPPSGCRLCTAR
jgi:hypothetical protein